jgi:hypothetical protein
MKSQNAISYGSNVHQYECIEVSKYVEDDRQTLAGFISNFLENSIVQRLKISRIQKLVVSALHRNFL